MSKYQLENALKSELQKLNEKIDLKILEGESYRREALRHRTLLAQMRQIRRRQWFRQSLSFMSLF